MVIKDDPVFVRRRRVALALLVALVATFGVGAARLLGGSSAQASVAGGLRGAAPTAQVTVSPRPPAPKPSPTVDQGAPGPSAETSLVRTLRLTGDLNSKSVVASAQGQVFAQNMMYQHTVVAFGADGARLATIEDSVDLAKFGVDGHPGVSRGAPVEMAFSPDGRTAWVSNYSMYGNGFGPEGRDACTDASRTSRSFVYRIDTSSYAVTAVVEVGAVPKYVAETPDGKHVLVTNWCSMDLSVIDTATAKVVATIPTTGQHPRGIAVSKDSRTAYIAVMGSDKVVAIDLVRRTTRDFARTGKGPRHVVISPDGTRLFVTNNADGTVVEVDASNGHVLRTVRVGVEPRSMAMSTDGGALYVVNYRSSTVSKIRVRDLKVIQTVRTDGMPIGITYEPTKKAVWVACYSGSILVFDDSRRPATT